MFRMYLKIFQMKFIMEIFSRYTYKYLLMHCQLQKMQCYSDSGVTIIDVLDNDKPGADGYIDAD